MNGWDGMGWDGMRWDGDGGTDGAPAKRAGPNAFLGLFFFLALFFFFFFFFLLLQRRPNNFNGRGSSPSRLDPETERRGREEEGDGENSRMDGVGNDSAGGGCVW